MRDTDETAGLFVLLSRELTGADDVPGLMARLVQLSALHVPGARDASLTLQGRRDRLPRTVAETDASCTALGESQYRSGRGPCVEALGTDDPVVVPDVERERARWPEFTETALRLGVRSVLALHLRVSDGDRMALNLFSDEPGGLDDRSQLFGRVVVAHAGIVLDAMHERDGLRSAIETRTLIGQAQGVLMHQHKISAESAFDVLRSASQARNVKLRVIAQEVVDTGLLT